MEKEQLEKLKELAKLFEEREQLFQTCTEKILHVLGPTVLAALYDVFETPYENVSWLETQLIESSLLLVCSVRYAQDQRVSAFVQKLSPSNAPEGRETIRLFRVGIPLKLLFVAREEVKQFLCKQAGITPPGETQETKPEVEAKPQETPALEQAVPPKQDFDSARLSREQVEQLLMFRHLEQGMKH